MSPVRRGSWRAAARIETCREEREAPRRRRTRSAESSAPRRDSARRSLRNAPADSDGVADRRARRFVSPRRVPAPAYARFAAAIAPAGSFPARSAYAARNSEPLREPSATSIGMAAWRGGASSQRSAYTRARIERRIGHQPASSVVWSSVEPRRREFDAQHARGDLPAPTASSTAGAPRRQRALAPGLARAAATSAPTVTRRRGRVPPARATLAERFERADARPSREAAGRERRDRALRCRGVTSARSAMQQRASSSLWPAARESPARSDGSVGGERA